MGSWGQDLVWAGKFWGFLNLSLCTSNTQLGRHITNAGPHAENKSKGVGDVWQGLSQFHLKLIHKVKIKINGS